MKAKWIKLRNRAIEMLSYVIPKRKNCWVFGSWQGKLYADNSKYMFEYVSSKQKSIDAIWITKSTDVQNEIRNKGYKCYLYNSIKGLWYTLRAKVAFETSGE